MTDQFRAVEETGGSHDVGARPWRLAPPASALFALLTAVLLAAGPAQAQENLIDFEQFRGPGDVTVAGPPLPVDEATFSGGGIATNVARLRSYNNSTVYGTTHFCSGCKKAITIEFSKPVSGVSFLAMNARLAGQFFEIEDDTGHSFEVELKGFQWRLRSHATVTVPSSGIRKITIQQRISPSSGFRRFYIDNLRYTVDEAQYQVSFSAFVPHDNVPAAPTAFCVPGENWLPPGLERFGSKSAGNARWARRDGFVPGNGRAPGIDSPADTGDGTGGNQRELFFAGDNRGFQPAAPTYRLRQSVTVVPDETVDADGVEAGSMRNLAGEARAYAEDAMADGIIDSADDDGISDDCRLFHRAYLSETDLMDVAVTRTGPKSLQIRFSGTLDSPLAGPAQVLGAIDWEFTLALDNSVEPGVWTLSGAHDGFPAYELYINGTPLYRHDPGAPPYDFNTNLRKLLPPMDIEVTEISGVLP